MFLPMALPSDCLLFVHFPPICLYVIEKWCLYPGDCHTSDIGHWFAMTGNSINSNLYACFVRPISIKIKTLPENRQRVYQPNQTAR